MMSKDAIASLIQKTTQRHIDDFYAKHGPCCAGCDWWRWHNSIAGECTRSAPVSGAVRVMLIGIHASSLEPGAGHLMTPRDYLCGEFIDSEQQKAKQDG